MATTGLLSPVPISVTWDDIIEEQLELLDKIEAVISPHGPALVDLYFRIVHPSFPILHKDVFLEKHSRSYRELTPACLAAVYMLALNWWSYSIDLAHLTKPDITELEKLVSSLMAFDRAAKVSDIQAGLLFLQRPRHDSWRLTAQLVATAEEVGLHRDCSDWQIPEWEKGVRKRVAWALFVQDKWGALVHGRPSHIKVDNWEVLPLELADFPENVDEEYAEQGSSEVERGILIFMHMSSLTQILSDIIDAMFTVQAAMNYATTADLLQAVKPLQLRLKAWYTNLPSVLDLGATQPRKLSATGQLYLAYLAAEVTLHRAIIESGLRQPLDTELRQITRGAAVMRFRSVIDFLKRLKPEHMQGFWHFASEPSLATIGTFSLVLLATSTETTESEDIFSQIAEFRWLLNINSSSADFTKTAIDLLRTNAEFLAQFRPQRSVGGRHPHFDGRTSQFHEREQAEIELEARRSDKANEARESQASPGEFLPPGLDVSPDQNWFYNFEDIELHS
ncbi:Fungal specific transcription factor [Rhinocladiella similis]